MKLHWSSISQPKALVPSNRLFYSYEDVVASPFTVIPVGVKPTQPLNSAVYIHAKDALLIKWQHPENYGGNAVKKYKIEWYSAWNTKEVQTLRMVNANNGTFLNQIRKQ